MALFVIAAVATWPIGVTASWAELEILLTLTSATLTAEVFTIEYPDRGRVSGGYVFPLVAAAIVGPSVAGLAALVGGCLSGIGRRERLRTMLFHGSRLALAACTASYLNQWFLGSDSLKTSVGGALWAGAFAMTYSLVGVGLGRIEEILAGRPGMYPAVDLVTNVLLVPIPIVLALVYGRAGFNGLALAAFSLLALLIIVRSYVNLGTLHTQVERAYAQLAEALEANRDLTQLVSHDLRGPLTAIMGYTQLLSRSLGKDSVNPAKHAEYLEHLNANSKRILRLIDSLQSLHRLEQPSALDFEPMDPAAVVEAAVRQLQTLADEQRVSIEVDIAADIGQITASEWVLREIADNLVSNAIKYSREGGQVRVALSRRQTGLQLEVQDDGLGMSPEDRAKLFTRFFRSSTAEVRNVPGTGLGLALIRSMIDRLGGRVDVSTELGRGSRFTVWLPEKVSAG